MDGGVRGVCRCPACGSSETHPFARAWDSEYCTTTESFTYCRCAGCLAIFLERPPTDRLAEIYPQSYYSFSGGEGGSIVQRLKRWLDGRVFRRVIAGIPSERVSVLDVGGGNGWLLSLIKEQNPRVVATHEVDIDPSVRAAAESAGHIFHCQQVEEFVPREPFDLIVLFNIIEHVADPGALLGQMRACLSDGGVILLKTPNTDTLDLRLFRHHNWGGFHCPRHWVLFDREGLVSLARRAGLECVWVRYTQGAPQWTNSILGWLSDRSLVTVTPGRPMHTHPMHAPLLAVTAAFDYLRRPFMPTAQMFVLLKQLGNRVEA